MELNRWWTCLVGLGLLLAGICWAKPPTYMPYKTLRTRLTQVARKDPDLVQLEKLARSDGDRELWLVTLGGASETNTRPALLVVAGLEGNDLVGTSIAVSWIESLVHAYGTDEVVTQLLDTTTLYVIPRANPDAAERYFAKPLIERATSDKPFDDDHDGLVDEDGPEDLNGDGRVTWMRVSDPDGNLILDPADDRLLLEADLFKGESGSWQYFSEGIDNDGDERWNEDDIGGVNFNRNFPHGYQFFAPDAGIHQVSEVETRALADFIVAHPEIGMVVTYGASDNLAQTPKGGSALKRRQALTAIDEKDLGFYKAFGAMYRDCLGLQKEVTAGQTVPGSFSDWIYYQRGRLSLAIDPWGPDLAMELFPLESSKQDGGGQDPNRPTSEEKETPANKPVEKRNASERKQLAWFDQRRPDAFSPWQAFDHPDFPGQTVEIGGYNPFVLSNPPESLLASVVTKQTNFLTEAAQRLPRLGIRKVTSKHLGEAVYEVEIEVENTGFLPTVLSHGTRTREVMPTRLTLDLPDAARLSGDKVVRLEPISGSGGIAKARFVIHSPHRHEIGFEIVSALAGALRGRIQLEEK